MSEKYKFPSKNFPNQLVKVIDRTELKGIIGSIGHAIDRKYTGQELILVATLKSAPTFLADLIREIKNVKVYIDFIKVKNIGREKESNGTFRILQDVSCDILDKNVLLIEGIIDSGRATEFMLERLRLSNPKSLGVATLFDRPNKRAVPLTIDHIGKRIDEHFLIGHGLDLEEYGRNAEDIYSLKFPN